jgi:hypothetical protein
MLNLSSKYLALSDSKQSKINLRKILKKYFIISKFSENLFNPNAIFNVNKKIKIDGLKKLLVSLHNNHLKRETYGFKPFTNLYYFKHNIMLYYLESYKRNNNNILALKNIFLKIFLKKIYYNIVNLRY